MANDSTSVSNAGTWLKRGAAAVALVIAALTLVVATVLDRIATGTSRASVMEGTVSTSPVWIALDSDHPEATLVLSVAHDEDLDLRSLIFAASQESGARVSADIGRDGDSMVHAPSFTCDGSDCAGLWVMRIELDDDEDWSVVRIQAHAEVRTWQSPRVSLQLMELDGGVGVVAASGVLPSTRPWQRAVIRSYDPPVHGALVAFGDAELTITSAGREIALADGAAFAMPAECGVQPCWTEVEFVRSETVKSVRSQRWWLVAPAGVVASVSAVNEDPPIRMVLSEAAPAYGVTFSGPADQPPDVVNLSMAVVFPEVPANEEIAVLVDGVEVARRVGHGADDGVRARVPDIELPACELPCELGVELHASDGIVDPLVNIELRSTSPLQRRGIQVDLEVVWP